MCSLKTIKKSNIRNSIKSRATKNTDSLSSIYQDAVFVMDGTIKMTFINLRDFSPWNKTKFRDFLPWSKTKSSKVYVDHITSMKDCWLENECAEPYRFNPTIHKMVQKRTRIKLGNGRIYDKGPHREFCYKRNISKSNKNRINPILKYVKR